MRLLALVLIALAASCTDNAQIVAPDPMRLSFEPARITLTGERTPEGRISCPSDIVIQAHGGTPDGFLSLDGILINFVNDAGVQTQTNTARPVDWFGSDRLNYNQRLVARRTLNGPAAPVTAQVVLSYRRVGQLPVADTLALICN